MASAIIGVLSVVLLLTLLFLRARHVAWLCLKDGERGRRWSTDTCAGYCIKTVKSAISFLGTAKFRSFT
jgi:hypothetical protein